MKTKIYAIALLLVAMSCKNATETSQSPDSPETNATEENMIPDTAHNSQNSLDYNGTYEGIIPCADCEGIKTVITLLEDGTFNRSVQYLGKEDEPKTDQGNYTWNKAGSAISLSTSPDETQMYKVGENVLFHLDREGNRIEGDLADNYKLFKKPA